MELIRRFPKGNALPPPTVPWYEATVTYVLLVPAALVSFINVTLVAGYWPCTEEYSTACVGGEVLKSSTGSYTAIVVVGALGVVVAFSAAIVAQLTVRKLFFPLVWLVAAFSLFSAVYVYGVMSGLAGTPWGHLIPL